MGYFSDNGFTDPILNFKNDSVQISYEKIALEFIIEGTNISNADGELQFYFNGCGLANYRHQIIENGTGFNPGYITNEYCKGSSNYPSGQQSMITLPFNNNPDQYIIFHERVNILSNKDTLFLYSDLNYSIVDISLNQGSGRVIKKNSPILSDTILGAGNLTAVKHTNGTDWWIIKQDSRNTNNYYKILMQGDQIIESGKQSIGNSWIRDGGSQAAFSADGTKYMRFSGMDGLYVMDFDRSNAIFSNFRHLPTTQEALVSGASFSPNGRFVYLGNGPHLYQVDLDDEILRLDTVAIWDGSFGNDFNQPNWFGAMQTGPDCRIYMHTGYCLPYMHIIMEPDKKGKDCDVRQHVLKFETPVCNIPYFPNFRLDTPYPYCNPEIVVVTGTSDFNPIVTTEKQISIHPNPSSGIFTIYAPDPIQSVSVYDLHGRRWMQQSGDLSDVLEINGTSLFSGMYIIKVVCGNNKIYTSRILKID
ncbi:MAG: T9SS type A sorting domain-containing protein [Saprospiraceae bacterium]|nr:T9SS type A sorting domain-containing protein [Saprospiraceae bacterium]